MSTGPFRITIDTSRVESWFAKIPSKAAIRGKEGMREWGSGVLVKELLKSAHAAGINQFRSNRSMFTSTRYIQKQNDGYVFMPKSGLYQDRAKPHWVSVTRNKPMLWAWARRHNFNGGSFWFTPKPFIKRGVMNATSRLPPIQARKIRQAISESH